MQFFKIIIKANKIGACTRRKNSNRKNPHKDKNKKKTSEAPIKKNKIKNWT